MKKIKKNFFLTNKKKNNLEESFFGSLSRTLLASLIIMSIFFISPKVIELSKKTTLLSADFENNSKNNLKKLLEKKDFKSDEDVNQKSLFEDILIIDEQPIDTVRLSASTIEELFKSTNYNLDDVRKTKLVKPISLTLLPREIKKIENAKKRKNLFIQIILPLVIKENNIIKSDRKKLFSILNKSKNTKLEWMKFQHQWLLHKLQKKLVGVRRDLLRKVTRYLVNGPGLVRE